MRAACAGLSLLALIPLLGAAPPPAAPVLDQGEDIKEITLCTDGKSHYVVVKPDKQDAWTLLYGDGKVFHAVPHPPPRTLSGEYFMDPRYYNGTANHDFRGIDVGLFSSVDADKKAGKCEARCGDRSRALQIVPDDRAAALLKAARAQPSPRKWEPYALARDDSGTYYFVDRGYAKENKNSFRLFTGQKGSLKVQKMTNVVHDSEGDIFSTKAGTLRLVLNKSEYLWVENEKPKKLVWVPVEHNLPMIYNDLGVYTGERMGLPCDDL